MAVPKDATVSVNGQQVALVTAVPLAQPVQAVSLQAGNLPEATLARAQPRRPDDSAVSNVRLAATTPPPSRFLVLMVPSFRPQVVIAELQRVGVPLPLRKLTESVRGKFGGFPDTPGDEWVSIVKAVVAQESSRVESSDGLVWLRS